MTGKLTGEISAGWGQQQSIERSFSPIEGGLNEHGPEAMPRVSSRR